MGISKITSEIFFTEEIEEKLSEIIDKYAPRKVYLATESTVNELCRPQIQDLLDKREIREVVIPAGEQNKKIESAALIWEFLSKNGADRKSLLLNFGGGMLTDLAGFAAATFKRGIDFVNIPTTLLAQVDASVGGKTGINFNGLKNEVGAFREPNAVLINVNFLKTLDHKNFMSGFAEMIKHGLIRSTDHIAELKAFDPNRFHYKKLEEIITHSVDVKKYFVESDPTEKGIRKALNFGHTVGHAVESLAMEQQRPLLHGFAVAAGIVTELFLSVRKKGFPVDESNSVTQWITRNYGKFEFDKADIERLFDLITHDKKNVEGRINFTLLTEPGKVEINQDCSRHEILEALEFYRDLKI